MSKPPSPASSGNQLNDKVKRYLQAGTRDNTRKSYRSAIKHYEITWGGLLPATPEMICNYLSDKTDSLNPATLQLHLAALSSWHESQGFINPTRHPLVKKILKGIMAIHGQQTRQASPMQIEQLQTICAHLDAQIQKTEERKTLLPLYRNKALMLVGFWRAFRSDELARITVENISEKDDGLEIYLPGSKTDRSYGGQTYFLPRLKQLCPVTALKNWADISMLAEGPLFCGIDRWGNIREKALYPNNINVIIKKIVQDAGLDNSDQYSSHSLRRGFASWANSNDWDLVSLMQYVGWKEHRSALRYINKDKAIQNKINQALK